MWNPPIVKTVATESKGIEDLATAISGHLDFLKDGPEAAIERRRSIARWRVLELLQERLVNDFLKKNGSSEWLESVSKQIAEKGTDPYSAVDEILKK
jgi:LAO/AO transport system kinase